MARLSKKKIFLNIKCEFCFPVQLLSEMLLTLKRIQRGTVINVKTSSCEVPVMLVGFYWNLNFLDRFSKRFKI